MEIPRPGPAGGPDDNQRMPGIGLLTLLDVLARLDGMRQGLLLPLPQFTQITFIGRKSTGHQF